MTKLLAKVEKWNHNRRLLSVQMTAAEPHVMRFVGDCGTELFGDDAVTMMNELMELGHAFTVETVFVDACVLDFA